MLIYYVRHGEPIYTPNQLTPLGRRQAEAVAKRVAHYGIDEVYASTSNRAIETATPTCEILGKQAILLDWINESYAYGEMAVHVTEEKKAWVWVHPEYRDLFRSRELGLMNYQWYEHPALAKFDFGRGVRRIDVEADAWLASLGYEHDREKGLYKVSTDDTEKRIALFAHEGAGKLFLSSILDIPLPYFSSKFELSHTGVCVIYIDGKCGEYGHARLLTVSNDSHLYREGLPTKHRSTGLTLYY